MPPSPEPSLLQAEEPNSALVVEVLQPSDHLHGPPIDPLLQLQVVLVLVTPELDTVLQAGSHQSSVDGKDHLPQPAGHAALDATQDTVGFLGCKPLNSLGYFMLAYCISQIFTCLKPKAKGMRKGKGFKELWKTQPKAMLRKI